MSDLKPCHFCGGKATISSNVDFEPAGIWCPKCHVVVKFTGVKPPGENEKFGRCIDDLIELWNRRAKDEPD